MLGRAVKAGGELGSHQAKPGTLWHVADLSQAHGRAELYPSLTLTLTCHGVQGGGWLGWGGGGGLNRR